MGWYCATAGPSMCPTLARPRLIPAPVSVGEGVADDVGFRKSRTRAEKKREKLGRKEEDPRDQMRRVKEEKRRVDAALQRVSLSHPFPT